MRVQAWLWGGWVVMMVMACGGCQQPDISRQPLVVPAHEVRTVERAPAPTGPRMQTSETLVASLTVVPPAVATQNQRVEVRLGLRNPSAQPLRVTVQFYISLVHDSMRLMTDAQTLQVAPQSTHLVTTFWAPVAFHGHHTVIAVVQDDGQRIAELSWPLRILPPFPQASGGYMAGVPFFTGVWLELGALGFFPAQTITAEDIRRLVRTYHARGMDTLVIAYPEFGGCFYYPSMLQVTWEDYSPCVFNTRTYFYDCAEPPKVMAPAQHAGDRCPFVAAFDVIGTILDEAERHGMQVILGLGRSGDLYFALALEDYYIAAHDGIPNAIDPVLLNRRLFQMVTISQAIAEELWNKYGHFRSLYGWFLSHETTCYDVSRNLYDPVAAAVKQRTMPDRPVMVAPYAVRNCLQSNTTIPTHIKDSAVDIYFYQDAVGSSVASPSYQFDPHQRIAELSEDYTELGRWHAGTGKHLWGSVEIWRASPTGDQRTSLSGPWETEVALQVAQAGRSAQALVLNEGLFYFENGVEALQLPGLAKRASAEALTQGYCRDAQAYITLMQAP